LTLFFVISEKAKAQIDTTLDFVIFNIKKPTAINGFVDVEVSIKAHVPIQALDFSLKFNQPKLSYYQMIYHASYLQSPLPNYNNFDQTLRFTSYALQDYELNKDILAIRFQVNGNTLDSTDIYSIKGYLNGDRCGLVVKDSSTAKVKNVHGINNLKEHLACGDQHTIALKTNGEVWAWGTNASGQLGNNSTTQSSVPIRVNGVNNVGFLNDAIAVAAGADHSLAILCDGSVVAWGNNSLGQLGNGTHTQSLFPIQVQGLPTGVRAFSIAAGDFHSAVVMEDGTVWTWGGNANGQLGNNTTNEALTAVQVRGIANSGFLTAAFEVAAGGSHTLVLMRDSTVCAFGDAGKGQTGNGNFGGNDVTPVKVLDNVSNLELKNVISIEGGNDHSIAVQVNGTVKTWGGNSSGQLGDGTTVDKAKAISVAGIGAAKSVAAGFGFSGVILRDSSTWTWGVNSFGQLGDNTKGTNRLLPVQRHGILNVGFLQSAMAIAAGKEFCTELIDDNFYGTYCSSGYNLNGQLGDNTLISKSVPVYVFGNLATGLLKATFTPAAGTPVCFPTGNVTFNNTTTNTTTGTISYLWTFGNDATPQSSTSSTSVPVTYSSTGTKTITLVVTTNTNCFGSWTDTLRQTINVVGGADASFTFSSAQGCVGQGMNFYSAGSKGSGVLHSWDFDLDTIPANAVDENPLNIIYTQAGAYTIVHTVSVPNCATSNTKSLTLTVNPSPVASFTSTDSVCANTSLSFTFTGVYELGSLAFWEFGKDASSETSNSHTPNPITYNTSGRKNITLNVTNLFGCTTSVSDSILIKNTPVLNIINNSNFEVCTGVPFNLQNTGDSTNILSAWSFGNSAFPASTIAKNASNIIYNSGGTKTYTLLAIDTITQCSTNLSQNINVYQTPLSTFSVNNALCAQNNVAFSSLNNKVSTGSSWDYSWNFGSDASPVSASTKDVSNVVYNTSGQKLITLIISDQHCSSTSTDTLLFYDKPFANAGNDTNVCGPATFNIGSTALPNYSYVWSPTNGLNKANIAQPLLSPPQGFTHYILTVTNDTLGCTAVDTVVVAGAPALQVATGNDQTICENTEAVLGANAVSGQTYLWSPGFGLNDSTLSNPTVNSDSSITYKLVVNGFGCAPDSATINVTVNKLPLVFIGANDTIAKGKSIQLEAGGGVSYSWSPSFGLSNDGIFNPVANPEITTAYTVTVTNIFGCSDTASQIIYVQSAKYWIPKAFSPDGNGKNDVLYVRGDGIENFEFVIFNSAGDLLFKSNNINEGWNGKRNNTGEELPEGAYVFFVKGTQNNGSTINDNGLVNLIR